ncbi:hypothetical protein [Micromonospora globbae]|uniref:hypothetical protein n=1 Tax=Micromonospora globbae TaxID=1894969 RepID=UPI0034375728|nr:hypothetical protein OH732_02230 [Micromonospora globbae]
MNWRQFTVALVQALAWPSVVAVVLLAYRRRIAQLLGDNLRRLTVGPIAAEWERVAEETRATIDAVESLPTSEEGAAAPSEAQQLLRLARVLVRLNPSLSIVKSWQASRVAFEDHLPMDDEEFREVRTLRPMLKRAIARGLIKSEAGLVFEQLQTLAFMADRVEGQKPTAEQAEDYLRLVEAFLALLAADTKAGEGANKTA